MGFNILAVNNLKYEDDISKAENLSYTFDGHVLYSCKYTKDWRGSISPGIYVETAETEVYSFSAGTYSRYSVFRDVLNTFDGDSFSPLLDFFDWTGYIGPEVSKDLEKSFTENRDKFFSFIDSGKFYSDSYSHIDQYTSFERAFEVASNNGVVIFT